MKNLGGGLVAVEDGVHAIKDGGARSDFLRGFVDGECIGNAFCDHAEAFFRVCGSLPSSEGEADLMVAGVKGKAGGDEVANAREAGKGFGLAPELGSETSHFGKSPGSEGGEGVVAELETGRDSGSESVDVFDCSSDFDTDQIGGGVDTKGVGGELVLEFVGKLFFRSSDDSAGGEAAGDFFGMIWAREHGYGIVGEDLGEDLGHAQASAALDPFGAREENRIGFDEGFAGLGGAAKVGGGDDEKYQFGGGEAVCGGGAGGELIGKGSA